MTLDRVEIVSGTVAVAERLRRAREERERLRVMGVGTWIDAGRAVASTATMSIGHDRGIVEYVPGDLTLTARAGTTLAEIELATREHGQWLPLDPWGGDAGSIGATVSTATTGPHAYAFGLPRDNVLGVEMVTGAGHVVRAGGRVVKNVAGFDLTRLAIGSWGTLGVITEITVRLRSRPQHTRTVAFRAAKDAGGLSAVAVKLRALPFAPLACELVDGALAARMGLRSGPAMIVRLGGNRRALDAQVDAFRTLAELDDAPDDVWSALRRSDTPGAATWRWSNLPSLFGDTWTAAAAATHEFPEALLHGSVLRGVVRVIVPAHSSIPAEDLARAATAFTGTIAIEALPRHAWPLVDLPPAHEVLSRAIRAKFDPDGILNPGIAGEGSDGHRGPSV